MITLIPCLYWAPIPVGPSSFLLFSLFLAAVDQIWFKTLLNKKIEDCKTRENEK
jgi:hypothetical protein